MKVLKNIGHFCRKEVVLTAAWAAAVISAFLVPPDAGYLSYIDLRSLGILWSLMVIMEGLKSIGFFSNLGAGLLKKTRRIWQLAAVLIFLCFFLSMLITNDVALITFVPFTVFILSQIRLNELLIPVIVLETLAANLGSMLTPIGNPQNLYLYGLSGMPFGAFLGLMLPYTAATFLLLVLSICLLSDKNKRLPKATLTAASESDTSYKTSVSIYGLLFILALLVVLRILPFWVLCAVVLIVVFFLKKQLLIKVDYALLFTFIGFFIFTGNLGRIPSVSRVLTDIIAGREAVTAVIASQVISNVPAALLLSGFTDNYRELIVGVNLGGLGTLIASMASLISYKAVANSCPGKKGRYFLVFTIMNVIYLAALLLFRHLWGLLG
ncbi:MAG: citrate transporter [Parasporobacterium sp.]|nr:citrate transporter [Parasporobacterium sp.]